MIATIATYFEKEQRYSFVERTLAATGVIRRTLFNIRKKVKHESKNKRIKNVFNRIRTHVIMIHSPKG